jgi:hypothetical protein
MSFRRYKIGAAFNAAVLVADLEAVAQDAAHVEGSVLLRGDLQPQHPVDRVPLLPVEPVQGFGYRAGVDLQEGVPVSLELLRALLPGRQGSELGLGHPAGALQLLQLRAELRQGH